MNCLYFTPFYLFLSTIASDEVFFTIFQVTNKKKQINQHYLIVYGYFCEFFNGYWSLKVVVSYLSVVRMVLYFSPDESYNYKLVFFKVRFMRSYYSFYQSNTINPSRRRALWRLIYLLATPEALGSLWVCFMCSIRLSPPMNILWHNGHVVAFGPPMRAACCCKRPMHCWQICRLIILPNQTKPCTILFAKFNFVWFDSNIQFEITFFPIGTLNVQIFYSGC